MNVLLGIGNPRHGDDALGVVFARAFRRPGWVGIAAGTTPENHTAQIQRLAPHALVLLDACEMGEAPGTLKMLDPTGLQALGFGTHAPSIQLFLSFLQNEMPGLRVGLIGIQPQHRTPGAPLSPPVRETLRRLLRSPEECPFEENVFP